MPEGAESYGKVQAAIGDLRSEGVKRALSRHAQVLIFADSEILSAEITHVVASSRIGERSIW